jgi:hypothetical protein
VPQTATCATALKEPPDAALAQTSTHARRRTSGRHHVAQPRTRPSAHSSQAPALLQGGTRPTHATHPRRQAPPPRTHAAAETPAAHPCRTCAPRMQERPEHTRPLMHPVMSPETRFSVYGSRARATLAIRSRPVHMAWDRDA